VTLNEQIVAVIVGHWGKSQYTWERADHELIEKIAKLWPTREALEQAIKEVIPHSWEDIQTGNRNQVLDKPEQQAARTPLDELAIKLQQHLQGGAGHHIYYLPDCPVCSGGKL
jgi:phosphopantetheinyl transferase (holo-ACP synthase)